MSSADKSGDRCSRKKSRKEVTKLLSLLLWRQEIPKPQGKVRNIPCTALIKGMEKPPELSFPCLNQLMDFGAGILPFPPFPCLSMEHPELRFPQEPQQGAWAPALGAPAAPGPVDFQIYPADKQQDAEFSSQGTQTEASLDFQWLEKQGCLFSNCFILQTNFPQC